MGLEEEFLEYAEKAKTLPETTTDQSKLILYGLYKQATVGPVNTSGAVIVERSGEALWRINNSGKSFEEMIEAIEKVKTHKDQGS